MKFSSKLALAAAASLLSVSSFAIVDMPDLSTADDIGAAELLSAGTSTGDGPVAFIVQTTTGAMATIQQTGLANFGVITQAVGGAMAAVVQTGDNNTAYIKQD